MDALKCLLELPLFSGVSEPDLAHVLSLARIQELQENELLMDAGEEGTDIAVVLDGSFTVELGKGDTVLPLAWISKGEVLGETTLFRRSTTRTARVRAAQPAVVMRLETALLDELVRGGNGVPRAIEEAVMRALARRIHDSVEAIDGVLAAHLDSNHSRSRPFGRLRELLSR